ncbi:uncharacterized protein LOC120331086 [Styela clava]
MQEVKFAEFELKYVEVVDASCLTTYCGEACVKSSEQHLTHCDMCISTKCAYDSDITPFFDHLKCTIKARKECSKNHLCSDVIDRSSCVECMDYCLSKAARKRIWSKLMEKCKNDCTEDECFINKTSNECIACKLRCNLPVSTTQK